MEGKLIELQQKKNEEQTRQIIELKDEVEILKAEIVQIKDNLVCKGNKIYTYIATGIAVVSLVLAMIGLL